jgi:hypothetical protein
MTPLGELTGSWIVRYGALEDGAHKDRCEVSSNRFVAGRATSRPSSVTRDAIGVSRLGQKCSPVYYNEFSQAAGAMAHRVVIREVVVSTILAIVLGIALSMGAVYLANRYLGPADQPEALVVGCSVASIT